MKNRVSLVATGALLLTACHGRVSLGDAPEEQRAPLGTPEPSPRGDEGDAATEQDSSSNESNVPPDSPTYVTGPLGFIVRGASSYSGSAYPSDMCGFYSSPENTRTARGILLTSYPDACTRATVPDGGRILRIDFTAGAGEVPAPGTYAITSGVDGAAACGGTQTAAGVACSTVSAHDGNHASGTLELSKSDATGMEGTFELNFGAGVVTGRFVAPRCADGASVCGIN